jgi:hypothetical protein
MNKSMEGIFCHNNILIFSGKKREKKFKNNIFNFFFGSHFESNFSFGSIILTNFFDF